MNAKILLLLLVATTSTHALNIRVYDQANHDRFFNFPSSPSANTSFIHAGVDLTGVAWYSADIRRQYTMVSPKHFIGANHFRPSNNESLNFLSSDGVTVRTFAIGTTQPIFNSAGEATDLFIGTLEEEIQENSGITFQPYLNLATEGSYIGQNIIFLGAFARGGRSVINAINDFGGDPVTGSSGINTTRVFEMVYNTTGGLVDDAHAEVGDSGSPSLVLSNGKAAIVGTHTAVLNTLGTVTSIDTFIPHYIEELNAIMEVEGYHMTKATPPSTTLNVVNEVPALIRAAYPFSIKTTVSNTGFISDANNVKFSQSFSAQPSMLSSTGGGWISEVSPTGLASRRGGIATTSSVDLMTTVTVANAQALNYVITFSADEFVEATESIQLQVIESFRSWSSNLMNASPEGDDDGDGISNLLEYAFGGDPEMNSLLQENSSIGLLPTLGINNEAQLVFTFVQRKDAATRALSYELESSDDLSNDWMGASSEIMSEEINSLNQDFEIVRYTLQPSVDRKFYRTKISLNE